jgi:uncharacterized protein
VTDFDLGGAVLRLARSAIAERLGVGQLEAISHASLEQISATFVTLTQGAELRGCVGTLERTRPLHEDVCENAVAAAFGDPRFPPLDARELPQISLEVSLLSPEERIDAASERALIAQLRPGIDGLIIEFTGRRTTLLPQVWQRLKDPREFLAALKDKAGLPEDFWSPGLIVRRYQATSWKEPERESAGVAP